jgi:hypothetical protein
MQPQAEDFLMEQIKKEQLAITVIVLIYFQKGATNLPVRCVQNLHCVPLCVAI